MPDKFDNRDERNSLTDEEVALIPWPLCQQYEMIHHWMDKQEPLSALLQLRNTSETLIKLLATLFLAYDLRKAQNGGALDPDSPIFWFVQEGGLSLGIWNQEIFLPYKNKRNNPMLETFFNVMSPREKRYWKADPLSYFVQHRNQLVHGILLQDKCQYYETAQEWLEKLDECLQNLLAFFEQITLFTQAPVEPALDWTAANFPFTPPIHTPGVLYPFHISEYIDLALIYPVYVKLEADTLSLAPILSVQACGARQELSVFFLHEYKSMMKKANAKFREFLVKGITTNKKVEFLQKLSAQAPVHRRETEDHDVVDIKQKDISRLESVQDYSKNMPVDDLIQQVQSYLETRPKGAMILQGTGGVGKSWFCKTLSRYIRNVAFLYIPLRRDISLLTFLKTIEIVCKRHAWVFETTSIGLQQFDAFVPEVCKRIKENCPRRKLVLVLDGWDILPENAELFCYFAFAASALPEGCFVLIPTRMEIQTKAKTILDKILQDGSHAISWEMQPHQMIQTLKTYIDSEGLTPYTQFILEKSQNIFLYVYHSCYLLNMKAWDSQALPDMTDLYKTFFQHLSRRVGLTLYNRIYVPILSMLAVACEPVSLHQLTCWGAQEADAEIVLQDMNHLLEHRMIADEMTYSIRHQDILDFFQTQEEWRKSCQEQEARILFWSKKTLQDILQNPDNELDEPEQYAIRNTVTHWNAMATRDPVAAQQLFPLQECEQMILLAKNHSDILEICHCIKMAIQKIQP